VLYSGGSLTASAVTVADEATDTSCFPLFVTAATGDLGPKTVAAFTLNSNTGALGASSVTATGLLQAGTTLGISTDVLLHRDAAAALALRNSTTAQNFRVYNTESSSLTNYERGNVGWAANVFTIETAAAGTGTVRAISILSGAGALIVRAAAGAASLGSTGNNTFIDVGNAANCVFRFNGSNIVYFEGNLGHLEWINDNTADIGASGANRPRTLYLGTMLRTPKIETPRVSELTIATGAITVTGSYHDVDTQSDDATDDLDTINGGTDGMRLVLRANNSGRTVVVKDGTGNIQCVGDMSLDNIQDTIELIYDGVQTAWLEIGRSDSGA
jgi:hypothetical protein